MMNIAELYTRHKSELTTKLTAYSRDSHGAEDAVQWAYLKALSGNVLDDAPENTAVAWLYTTAKNALIDDKRKLRRLTLLNTDIPLNAPDPDDFLLVRELLGKLSPEQRQLVSLRWLAGLTSMEIGSILSISPATVRTRLRAALKRIRDEITRPNSK
jgi:RNA polymerase sigma-70 factor (ECF subfamily)